MIEVQVVRLDHELALPSYARVGDAGIDLVARHGALVPHAGGRVLIPTGLALAIPAGHAGFVLPRSGLALRHGITLMNAPGLIDAGYRDELKVIVLNTDPIADFELHRGDRIAQLVILPVPAIAWLEVDTLEGESRGGGFGHTGR